MKPQITIPAFVLVAILVSPAVAQSTGGSSTSSTVTTTGQRHTPMDSSQAMASAGFRTLPISEVVGMKLYDSKGEVFGDVKQVVLNEKGRDSIIVTRTGSSGIDLVIPLEKIAVRSDRLFAHDLSDDQLHAMPAMKAGSGVQMDDNKTVEIGAEN
jgi:sporulation protein YlmC with PRC-barrel domain